MPNLGGLRRTHSTNPSVWMCIMGAPFRRIVDPYLGTPHKFELREHGPFPHLQRLPHWQVPDFLLAKRDPKMKAEIFHLSGGSGGLNKYTCSLCA